jgi:hypothetical protein
MKDRTLDDLPAYPPVLDAPLVARIHELNGDYVDLLVDRHAAGRLTPPLPPSVMDSLAMLSGDRRRELARTSYSLYSLGFESSSFWRSAAGTTGLPATSRYVHDTCDEHSAFCEVAVFHAWHSAVSNPLAARVVYGMPDAVLQSLSVMPPWRVKRLGAELSRVLQPRWPCNPRFWPDLVKFAADEDARRLAAAQVLGNQLLASELERAQRMRAS